jgi:protein-S-isoprenylcysteine O-methyltransferase Ste14/NAD-dependent dihydropyrimidine dehydrogenase PreA subunit
LPIDPDFQKNREKVGKEEGIAIWGPLEPPDKLGIRGTNVAVDWDLCTGCGTCIEVCPVKLYEWKDTPSHPTSDKKAFPTRESDCAYCFECENQCPTKAIRVTSEGASVPLSDTLFGWLILGEIIGGPVYGAIFGPFLMLKIPFYLGWIVLAVGLSLFISSLKSFRQKGKVADGKSIMDTSVIVDSGTYAIVRHPQFLGGTLLISASILISQHWLSAIIGVLALVWLYTDVLPRAEKELLIKFGDDYRRYMERVPRLNPIVGLIRLLREGRS